MGESNTNPHFFHLKSSPKIMGILNLTPDSFFAGSRAADLAQAKSSIETMRAEGADIIDIGAESTQPGAAPISVNEELSRLIPILEWLQHQEIPYSIDTQKTDVMAAVLSYKPSMINDVNGFRAVGALEVVADGPMDICIMHMQNNPENMQENPAYTDVVSEILTFFEARLKACDALGIDKHRIILDPGFGFGKTLQHNIKVLQSLQAFSALGCRVLVGMSRKAMIGAILNKPVDERLYGSLTAHTVAFLQGADIIRTHDVAATKDALKVLQALRQEI
ncbi:MAG: dihydropteroate synthase [Gammaproteobacteria bacterium]